MSENQRAEFQQQPVAARIRRLSNTSSTKPIIDSTKSNLPLGYTAKEIVCVLKKAASTRNEEEVKMLEEWSLLMPKDQARIRSEMYKSVLKQRAIEQEESIESIEQKAETLANMIREANYIVIYTGAGISTSASIPDYRGPNGLWTQIKKTGTFSITKIHDLTSAEPTITHMAIRELCRRRLVKHVVSQNCDGLHLRSGIPQAQLSEIHGNMYIEVCPTCEKQYYRQADITERTSRFRHKTGRQCHTCAEPNNNLIDTIVLYGERSRTKWPMNWDRAGKAAKRADLIICMGSSLKTLRRYNCLWPKSIHSSGNKEPETKLAIINLQYTSKDRQAVLKINGKCDLVMQLVMQKLNINVPDYDWLNDPLQKLAIPFTQLERADLKGNLIFEFKLASQSSNSQNPGQVKRSADDVSAEAQGLFVSELTDDPEKKRLRMRIRAVIAGTPTKLTESSATSQEVVSLGEETSESYQDEETEKPDNLQKMKHTLPGWLGKSLGTSRTSSYRRKRHGNKGRSRSIGSKLNSKTNIITTHDSSNLMVDPLIKIERDAEIDQIVSDKEDQEDVTNTC